MNKQTVGLTAVLVSFLSFVASNWLAAFGYGLEFIAFAVFWLVVLLFAAASISERRNG